MRAYTFGHKPVRERHPVRKCHEEQISPVPEGGVLNHSRDPLSQHEHSSPGGEVQVSLSVPSTTSAPSTADPTPTSGPSGMIPRVRAQKRVYALARQDDLQLACELAERLERRWFMSRLRGALPDGMREQAKLLRTMRGVRLLLFWARQRP